MRTLVLGLVSVACSGVGASENSRPIATPTRATTTSARPVDDQVCLSQRPDEPRCWLELDASDGGPAPLLIDLHGSGQTAARLRMYSGMESVAVREGLVVVWPDSPDRSWQDGARGAGSDLRGDVTFIGAVIDHVSARLAIDDQRVYLTGFSSGCSLAQRVAARRSDLIAAVACYSDYLFDEPAPDYEPVPVLQIHGTADRNVPYEQVGTRPGALANAATWARHNDCVSPPDITRTDLLVTYGYAGCRDDAEVIHIAIVDGGHVPTPDVMIHDVLWEFLDRH